jgi:hypothetical protein
MWKACVIYCTDKVFVYGKVILQIIWINLAEDRGHWSRDSVVCIETRSRAGRFESRQGKLLFLLSKTSRPVQGRTQGRIQWVVGFFPGSEAAGV